MLGRGRPGYANGGRAAVGRVVGAAAVLASLAAAPAHASGPEETVPGADDRLTLAELRWCLFEPVRLEGDNAETDAGATGGRRHKRPAPPYTGGVREDIPGIGRRRPRGRSSRPTQALRRDGVARVRQARTEREKRRVYVKTEEAAVRVSPGSAGEEIGRVPRWGDLVRTGRTQGPWYEVEWRAPKSGWVLEGLVQAGSGEKARFDFCEANAGQRARHNEIIRGRTEPGRFGSIRILNDTGKDAYVKLVNRQGKVALAFVVGEEKTAVLKGYPLGSYEVAFATGEKSAAGCDSFSSEATRGSSRSGSTHTRTAADGLSVHSVTVGKARTNAIRYGRF